MHDEDIIRHDPGFTPAAAGSVAAQKPYADMAGPLDPVSPLDNAQAELSEALAQLDSQIVAFINRAAPILLPERGELAEKDTLAAVAPERSPHVAFLHDRIAWVQKMTAVVAEANRRIEC